MIKDKSSKKSDSKKSLDSENNNKLVKKVKSVKREDYIPKNDNQDEEIDIPKPSHKPKTAKKPVEKTDTEHNIIQNDERQPDNLILRPRKDYNPQPPNNTDEQAQ